MKKDGDRDPFYDVENLVSATECTGLMPTLAQDEEQDEHYAALYAIHDAEQKKKKEKK